MAFKMKPSGIKKCSYSGMKKKGLLNDSPSTYNGNTMAYQKFDPQEAQKKAEKASEQKETDTLKSNYQGYTEAEMKEGKERAGTIAAIAAAKAGKTKFKYGGSFYNIPADILAQYSK